MRKMALLSLAAAALTATLAAPANAALLTFAAPMTGAAEAPPNASTATGNARVTFDTVAITMLVQATFSGLLAPTTVAHVHCCTATPFAATAGVASYPGTFPGWAAGSTSATYERLIDMNLTTSYTAAFLSANGGTALGAFNGLIAGIQAGRAYFNVHSERFPGGEIRGFLVPEPASAALVLVGLAALGAGLRRRRV